MFTSSDVLRTYHDYIVPSRTTNMELSAVVAAQAHHDPMLDIHEDTIPIFCLRCRREREPKLRGSMMGISVPVACGPQRFPSWSVDCGPQTFASWCGEDGTRNTDTILSGTRPTDVNSFLYELEGGNLTENDMWLSICIRFLDVEELVYVRSLSMDSRMIHECLDNGLQKGYQPSSVIPNSCDIYRALRCTNDTLFG